MLQPYLGAFRNIAFLWAHCGAAEDGGNRIYEVAAASLSPDRPGETFSSPVRYKPFTERERHASGLSRDALRDAPSLPDAAAFLGAFLRETEILLTLNPRETLASLLAGCGNPRVVDLGFAAEFFLPQTDCTALRPLWEHLQGKPRGKLSFTAREAVELSIDLARHISGRALDTAEFPPAAALRFHLGRSNTLFGDLFLHLNRNHRAYFGGLFDPSTGAETPEWKGFLEKAPPLQPLPESDPGRREIPVARLGDLYRGLAARAKGYAVRPSQIAYATEVASALNDRAVLTIEAGTGTGKTQGYLIPVMEFLRRNPHSRAAVSTYTKTLQEQIVRREIPLAVSLNRAYRKIPTALLKGKSNHLCAEKLDHLYEESLTGSRLLAWLYFVHRLFHFREADGDEIGGRIRSVLHDGFFFRRLQQESSARSGCGPRHTRCPAQVAAAEAANARLIVTNHHKLALLNRDETLGFLFENYVIDEANHFEQAVRGAFAIEIGSREMADDIAYAEIVLGRLAQATGESSGRGIDAAMGALNELRENTAALGAALLAVRAGAAPGEATVLPSEHPAFTDGRLRRHLDDLRKTLKGITAGMAFVKDAAACRRLGIRPRTSDRMKTALRAFQDHAETLKAIVELAPSPGHVASCTLYRRHWTISVRAVEVAGLLRDHIYSGRECVVFTSATLRQGEGFAGFRRAAGMPEEQANGGSDPEDPSAQERGRFRFAAIPSPFPPDAAEISVPPDALSGAFECKKAWLARVAELLPGLIRRNRGRTLVLFASYGDLEAVSGRIAADIQADGFPLLVQRNGAPTASLCDEFREIRESVLFGVDTFWYGVDFPGDTLTQVIITRLPFPHPRDPLQIARRSLLPREEYWKRYRYETEIKLRQGIGRLIRSEKDRGKVVILDARCRGMKTEGAFP
jgi:ATP-dependent DNA helicase DinG